MGMASELAISALDLVALREDEAVGDAIARSVKLAQHVEQLGYRRFWLAEHHSIPGLACSATAVLIGQVAGECVNLIGLALLLWRLPQRAAAV